jgi:tRNA A-37 threonylcarbamoyl transferase component Bud32
VTTHREAGPSVRRTVGRYEILRELGRGGMATVYLARQPDLDRLVALKELRAFRTDDPGVARRFLREARLAGSFNHPNIVTVHEYFEFDRVPYIAMECLPRGSLRRVPGGLTLAHIGGVLEGLLAGLAHAERRAIVHRDIKPENVLVTGEGGVKIADFGIAKATRALNATGELTAAGTTVGTPNYIAPEQAMARELGPATDLYSVGITTYELFTGRTPFGDSADAMAIVLRQINEPVPRVTNIDPRIADWIEWLVAKNPAARPQSAGEAWDGFEETLIHLLGPTWRRVAPLTEPGGAASSPRQAATVPPRHRATAVPQPSPLRAKRPRRLFPTPLRVATAAAALLVVGASVLPGRTGHAPAPTQPSQAPTLTATVVAPTRATRNEALKRAAEPAARSTVTTPATRRAKTPAQPGPREAPLTTTRHAQDPARSVTVTQASPTQPTPRTTPAPAPAQTQSPTESCAGDSLSDDPSDDDCGGP